jgi:hypothetical protein
MLSDPLLALRLEKQRLTTHIERAALLLLPHKARETPRPSVARSQLKPLPTLFLLEDAGPLRA